MGQDDMVVRVFNYNTLEKVHSFEAHTDYIRCLAVHPTQPIVLSCGDDMLIKMWDWDKKWQCVQVCFYFVFLFCVRSCMRVCRRVDCTEE